ncbi:RNA-directed RNA polymerase VP2 [Gossypium arboreum]|nr:RNA-directed RNA polymerase VP2 [Gossypium arboreum]
MWEDVVPPLKTILESQHHLSQIQLSFQDNKLEGSFLKNGWPYSFWAFFPNEELTGPKGFSLCSYGWGASTVEPFLVDEKKITAKHVVFWVEKRLAAQGIIPVWKE